MRGKRSKQYRKLMEQFSMTYGFREPYQVIVDAEMVKDSCRFKMDLEPALQRTVHGQVKPLITQCEIRKLYEQKKEPGMSDVISLAKTLERRRCGHHPDEYPEPLSTMECLQSVVDPKGNGTNKHCYVVATQDLDVRRNLRAVRGVPLVYIKRSVMILEPMADESAQSRVREEKMKFRAEIKKAIGKRKRDGDGGSDEENEPKTEEDKGTKEQQKKPKHKGPKGPNPLAMKKSKRKTQDDAAAAAAAPEKGTVRSESATDAPAKAKRKRRRRNRDNSDAASIPATEAPTAAIEA